MLFLRLLTWRTGRNSEESVERKKSGEQAAACKSGTGLPTWGDTGEVDGLVCDAIGNGSTQNVSTIITAISFRCRLSWPFLIFVTLNIIYYITDVSVVVSTTDNLLHGRTENDGLDLG